MRSYLVWVIAISRSEGIRGIIGRSSKINWENAQAGKPPKWNVWSLHDWGISTWFLFGKTRIFLDNHWPPRWIVVDAPNVFFFQIPSFNIHHFGDYFIDSLFLKIATSPTLMVYPISMMVHSPFNWSSFELMLLLLLLEDETLLNPWATFHQIMTVEPSCCYPDSAIEVIPEEKLKIKRKLVKLHIEIREKSEQSTKKAECNFEGARESMESILSEGFFRKHGAVAAVPFSFWGWDPSWVEAQRAETQLRNCVFFCWSFRTTAMEGIFQALYGCGAILLVIELTKASFMYQCIRNLMLTKKFRIPRFDNF